MAKYAYIRVSSKDQNIARQVEAMQEVGLTKKQMYIDKQSGRIREELSVYFLQDCQGY